MDKVCHDKHDLRESCTRVYGQGEKVYLFKQSVGTKVENFLTNRLQFNLKYSPDIKQEQADSIRLKFYVPSIRESLSICKMKLIENEEFKIINYKKPIYIDTYL